MLEFLKFWKKTPPAPPPEPILVAIPEEPKEDPVELYRAQKAAELTAEIERLRGLEVECATDSLRARYRSAREAHQGILSSL